MTLEILEGRDVDPSVDHIYLHFGHLPRETLAECLPGNYETAKNLAGARHFAKPSVKCGFVYRSASSGPTRQWWDGVLDGVVGRCVSALEERRCWLWWLLAAG